MSQHENESDFHTKTRTSTRQQTLTDKGFWWQIETLQKNFKRAVSAWKSWSNKIEIDLSDTKDTNTLREHRNILVENMNHLTSVSKQLTNLIENESKSREHCELTSDIENEVSKRFESCENDNADLMKRITNRIQEIERDNLESKGSYTSKSRSTRSSRSQKTSASQRSQAASRAAELKTKLKYLELEAKAKLELEKIQTMRELEATEAKLDVIDNVGQGSELDELKRSLPESSMLDKFLQHVTPDAKTDFDNLANDKVENTNNVSKSKLHTNVANTSMSVEGATASINQPAHGQSVPIVSQQGYSQSISFVDQSVQGQPVPNVSKIFSDQATMNASPSFVQNVGSPSVVLNKLSDSDPHVRFKPVVTNVSSNYGSTPIVTNVNSATLNPSATTFIPQSASNTTGHYVQVDDLTKAFAEQVNLGRLPPPEPSVFSGDPLKYPAWKSSFQTLIEQRKIPSFERIHYLRKYVGDSVRDVIENFLVLSTEDAYDDAKELLEKRYGDPFIIGNAFRNRLENWPKIPSRDNIALRKFSDFLKQCLSAMRTMGTLNALNDDRENKKLLSKLPDWVVTRWSRTVARYKEEKREFPPFQIFVDFVEKEATIANDPITSIQSVRSEGTRSETVHSASDKFKPYRFQHSKPNNQRRNVLATDTFKVEDNNRNHNNDRTCAFCQKTGHFIDICRQFLDKSVNERKQFAKEKGLCFGCLRAGHTSRNCKARKRCNICTKLHPTPLHGDLQSNNKSNNDKSPTSADEVSATSKAVHLNYSNSSCKSSMIVPVYVSHANDPSNERLVYALLDTQSDTTFILENTCEALGISGTDVKLSLSTMHCEDTLIDSCKIKGLIVRGYDSHLKIRLPLAYTRSIMPANRAHIPSSDVARQWRHLEEVADKFMPINDCEFGLLIGYDCARALTPREVIPGIGNEPYAQRTDLGWGIVGITDPTGIDNYDAIGYSHRLLALEVQPLTNDSEPTHVQYSFGVRTKEVKPSQIAKMMELDFSDRTDDKQPMSREDKRFLNILQDGIRRDENHYELPLPFKSSQPNLPNDKLLAQQRFEHLRKRLIKDTKYRNDYFKGMHDLIAKGYAERVDSAENSEGNVWYIPHHGVYHPQKPEKVRIVFDCSARFKGTSLNDHLLQGPDLTNSLTGVLCRFRQEPVAIVCDIEAMFLQFRVKPDHRDYLRFLWFENFVNIDNIAKEPVAYRMNVHLFGAASSPGCANYGLKQIANDYEGEFGSDAANFIRNDFYVDDGLKSVSDVDKAVSLIKTSQQMCSSGGLRLHKFRSNSKDVLAQIPTDDRAGDMKNIDLLKDELPITKTLGVQWCIESDSFQFNIDLTDKPVTRRGVLSTLSSIYDPLGFVSPVVLVAKRIFQDCCFNQDDWDTELSNDLIERWDYWRKDVLHLKTLEIPRCMKTSDFGKIVTCELHHFSDASSTGYGQCSYLRLINTDGQVHCSLVMSKARVVPRKSLTIPRLELSAAVVSVRISRLLRQELEFDNIVDWFWTDSNIVLGYIANESRRFHVFVSNRVQQIVDHTNPNQWKYVDSKSNPADIASRGSTAEELSRNSIWFNGPRFLWTNESILPDQSKPGLSLEDPEVRRVKTLTTKTEKYYSSILERIEYFSDWHRAKRSVANCLNLKDLLRKSYSKKNICSVTVDDMRRAELEIIRHVQKDAFNDEIEKLRLLKSPNGENDRQYAKLRNVTMKQTSSLYKLDPFLDSDGIIRVGGRIKRSDIDHNLKHPLILPRQSHITNLIIRHCHEVVQHQGRGLTINEIRSQGYWIIGCSSAVSKYISSCVSCRKLRGRTEVQKMSDLPFDRLEAVAPFTYCAVDFFGPFIVKEGRKELKRYGALFTCLSSRAVHIETANSLDTSSFINALRRFISVRGPIRHLRSDQGSNFIGARRELKEGFSEMDSERIRQYLLNNDCDYIEFKMNVPSASHMGGVWERQIRSIRNVLANLLDQLGSQLDDESLRTFMCEAASIVNSRPLTVENLNDPLSAEPLTPNHLLTMKSRIVLPPPGEFQRNDIYSRKRWRRVQYLANQFWERWRKEFLSNLQSRQKWVSEKRNLVEGDIVMIKDDNLSRNMWHIGRVCETYIDKDGLVRTVKLTIGSAKLDKHGKRQFCLSELERPIHKLVLLKETEVIPTEEPLS